MFRQQPQQGGIFGTIGSLVNALQPLAQMDTQRRNDEHMAKVFAANPDFAAKLYGARQSQQQIDFQQQQLQDQLRREQAKKSALAELAAQMGDSGIDMQSALLKLGQVDPETYLPLLVKQKTGADLPASLQIGYKMQELSDIMNDPNRPEQERLQAASLYNHIGQSAKTYGFDRGIQYGLGGISGIPQGQPSALEQIPSNVDGIAPIQNPDLMPTMPAGGQKAPPPTMSLASIGEPPTVTVAPTRVQPTAQAGVIPGYGQAAGSIAATKKGMEEQAAKDVQRTMNPLIAAETASAENAVRLRDNPLIEAATQEASETGKRTGEAKVQLGQMMASAPNLERVTRKLSALGKLATYTTAGKVRDWLVKEAGGNATDQATARTAMESTIDNEVLPLLRQTFGSAFTEAEGDWLKKSWLDPNTTPREKDASLRSFIESKFSAANSLARELGQEVPFTDEYIKKFTSSIGANPPKSEGNQFTDGQVIVNPSTGQRMIYRNGDWSPL